MSEDTSEAIDCTTLERPLAEEEIYVRYGNRLILIRWEVAKRVSVSTDA